MRVLDSGEVAAVAGGMIQCEPDPLGFLPLLDYGGCGADDVLRMLADWFGWYQWQAC